MQNPQKQKRKRIATGILIANSARRVVEVITIIYTPKNYKILRRIKHSESLQNLQLV